MEKIVLEPWMEEILNVYYKDGGKKLHGIIDRLFGKKYGGINNKDMDEFYSVANDVIVDICKHNRYDPSKGEFGGFLYGALDMAIIDEFKRQTRDKRVTKIEIEEKDTIGNIVKRRVSIHDVYMDAPIGEDGTSTMKDLLESDFNLENEFIDNQTFKEDKVENYLRSLSKVQRQIVKMKMDGYGISEIIKKINITEKDYERIMKTVRSYDKKKLLYRSNECEVTNSQCEENKIMETRTTTSEKTKDTHYSLESVCKKLKQRRLRDDHVLQRSSGQWSILYKSELVSDLLQGLALTQIIISEEIKDGVTMHWLIDGKQRCTNIEDFFNDGFAISKNVQVHDIQYQTDMTDKKGKVILNEDGFPIPANKTFDIRKKKFSQLPEELRDKLKEYQIPVMLNLNCTKKEIAYDIARFNRCRPMTVAQNGFTGLEEGYAEFIDNILKMDFFGSDSQKSSYRESNSKSGMMRRMIVESIVVSNYIGDFNKDFRKMCEHLTENANDSIFIEFYAMVERLTNESTSDIADMFNIRDSFLWFGLFNRFVKYDLPDADFVRFMKQFKEVLHSKKINDITFDELNDKSTKDKSIVIEKMKHLEQLMNEFLHINKQENTEDKQVINTKKFIEDNVGIVVEDRDVDFSEAILEDLILNVDNNSKLLEEDNMTSMLAIVAYSCEIDFDLDSWIIDYFNRYEDYIVEQKQNYLHMKEDLDNYIESTKNVKEQKTA